MPYIDTQLSQIDLNAISAELFSETAQAVANTVGLDQKTNKPTQLRRFYDEIITWDTRINTQPSSEKKKTEFEQCLPFIRMINAKAAYAKGRNLINEDYQYLIRHCLQQVNDPKSLHHFKLFMEAFMGFYKVERPKG